jgi:putative hydrolase of the HAD superfamily
MTSVKAIIFDYGNVLEGPVDKAAFEADLAELAQEFGFESGLDIWYHLYLSDAWEKAKRGQIARPEFWEDRLGALGLTTEAQRTDFKRRVHRHRILRPEMRELLRELKGRCRLAILSNTSRKEFARYLVERRDLDGVFDVVVSSAEVGIAKPDPAIYQIALDRLQVRPEEALFVDDLERNTNVAEELGIPSIVFTTVDALRAELKKRGIL